MRQITPEYLVEKLSDNVILLMLDYDGTIVPIYPKPELAVLPGSTKKILSSVAKSQGVIFSVISGRAREQISKVINIKKTIYVGNHGLEITTPHFKFNSMLSAPMQKKIQDIAQEMETAVIGKKGVIFENKGFTLSVHYRLVDKKNVSAIKKIIKDIVSKAAQKQLIKIHYGKKVIEIRPNVAWDKGKAALWLVKKYKIMYSGKKIIPVYIGDDRTDESAFSALKKNGLTVRVGYKKNSSAKYTLKDVSQVLEFLKMVAIRSK